MTTYDEWQKARVEAATDTFTERFMDSFWEYTDQTPMAMMEKAFKAADAVSLPDNAEVMSMVACMLWKQADPKEYEEQEGKISLDEHQHLSLADDILKALRPWIAAQIGRK